MKNFKQKRAAFTLAEILIVLMLIGVIATMTLPNLMRGVQEAQAGRADYPAGAYSHGRAPPPRRPRQVRGTAARCRLLSQARRRGE